MVDALILLRVLVAPLLLVRKAVGTELEVGKRTGELGSAPRGAPGASRTSGTAFYPCGTRCDLNGCDATLGYALSPTASDNNIHDNLRLLAPAAPHELCVGRGPTASVNCCSRHAATWSGPSRCAYFTRHSLQGSPFTCRLTWAPLGRDGRVAVVGSRGGRWTPSVAHASHWLDALRSYHPSVLPCSPSDPAPANRFTVRGCLSRTIRFRTVSGPTPSPHSRGRGGIMTGIMQPVPPRSARSPVVRQ